MQRAYLVLEAVATSLHVHDLGVGIVELALAQLAVEADDCSYLVPHLFDVLMAHWLHVLVTPKQTVHVWFRLCHGNDNSDTQAIKPD